MSDDAQEAIVKPIRTISKIWLVPLVALFVGLWMVYYQWSNQGSLVKIKFAVATGLEVGKTKVKALDVDIGVVEQIELSDNLAGVIVTVRMNKHIDTLLHADNQFWIVSPRISLKGVSGLGTILSGPYINMVKGFDEEMSKDFVALPSPPATPPGIPGLHVTLNSDSQFAYEEGDPIVYKGIKVGEFESIYFNFEERVVYYNVFIESPFHKLVTSNTKFWDVSGFDITLGTSGVEMNTGSLETLLTNGATFGVPNGMPPGTPINDRSYFDIHTDYESASEERFKFSAEYAILVKDTVRGLEVGAPVEYRGLKIGKVLSINGLETKHQSLLDENYDIPVVISIQPGRIQQPDNEQGVDFIQEQTSMWIEKGLKASLETGNLVTGALFVDLQHYPDSPTIEASYINNFEIIPTISNEFSEITAKVTSILDNINDIQLDKMSDNANTMLKEIANAASALQTTATKVDSAIVSAQSDKISKALVDTLQSLSTLSKDFSADSKTNNQLNQTMQSLQHTLQELQPLLLQLKNTPNSLIFNNGNGPRPMPKAKVIENNGVRD